MLAFEVIAACGKRSNWSMAVGLLQDARSNLPDVGELEHSTVEAGFYWGFPRLGQLRSAVAPRRACAELCADSLGPCRSLARGRGRAVASCSVLSPAEVEECMRHAQDLNLSREVPNKPRGSEFEDQRFRPRCTWTWQNRGAARVRVHAGLRM